MTLQEWLPWYVFCAYWAISALRVKRAKARGNAWERRAHIAVMLLASWMLLSRLFRFGPLAMRFVPENAAVQMAGIALTWMGVAGAIWARYCIGRYWSSVVALKEGHELIRSGPYNYVRHPIYTGMLLAVAGTALAIGEWRGVVAFGLALAGWSRKAKEEEALLLAEFRDQYRAYQRQTGFLIPRRR